MSRIREKAAWALVAVLALFVVASMAGVVRGGPLDPATGPAPTGKTLDEIPGSWSRDLPANDGAAGPSPPAGCNSTRFACVFGNAAVLDHETGLVWQLQPAAGTASWDLTVRGCLGDTTGGRMGWRLPSLEELRSLLGTSGLPSGHPFVDVAATFWTSTTVSDATTQAYRVFTSNPTATFTAVKGSGAFRGWCVRGAAGYDAY